MKLLQAAGIALICGALLIGQTSCSSMSTTTKSTAIGAGAGTAAGAGVGALIGGGKGAVIGAAIGAVAGTGAGYLIGKKMDQQQEQLQQELAEQATVETVTDEQGYQAIKVTFEGKILFPTNGTTLSSEAQADLTKFAVSLLNNPDTDVRIYGFTDNTGSMSANQKVATGRADAVLSWLVNCGVPVSRLTAQGVPMANYVASNDTEEGRAQNRRVEIYIYANQDMINQAEAGTLS